MRHFFNQLFLISGLSCTVILALTGTIFACGFGMLNLISLANDGEPLYVPLSRNITPMPTYTPVFSPNQAVSPPQLRGIEWVEIPPGSFWMGHEQKTVIEAPLHEVYLDRYWISKFPITNEQFAQFLTESGSKELHYNWVNDQYPSNETGDMPVGPVKWELTVAYLVWIDKQTDWQISIPSEAEWEKAARGDGPPLPYPWGYEVDSNKTNVCDRSCTVRYIHQRYPPERALDDGYPFKSPVDSFPEGVSPFGVYDMHGNLAEWTRSKYLPYPYDPNDPTRETLNLDDDNNIKRGVDFASPMYELSERFTTIQSLEGIRLVAYPPDCSSD